MSKLNEIATHYASDVADAKEFCDEMYNRIFADEFKDLRQLKDKMKSERSPITDAELEEILTTLPLRLFDISEKLNSVRLESETIRLRMKDYKQKRIVQLSEGEMYSVAGARMSASAQREWTTKAVNAEMADHELLLSAYTSVIDRVEREISMSRELIMGAKKIWDGRRSAESVNPVGEVVVPGADLPDYPGPIGVKTYIK